MNPAVHSPDHRGLNGITAVILAGGLGTRLRAVVSDRPKAMAAVAGRPLLVHLLERLEAAGVETAVLCVGHMGDQIERHFGAAFGRMKLTYAVEHALLGTGGALRNALPLIDSQSVLAMNGDSWCEADLSAFRRWHEERAATLSLLLTETPDRERFGGVETDSDGRVLGFLEKQPGSGAGWINAGVYLTARETIAHWPQGRVISLERDIFPALVGQGLHGWKGGGRFIDIGTQESYREADAFFSHPRAPY